MSARETKSALQRSRIGVLAGGVSAEREISLHSGKAVFDALTEAGYDVEWIPINTKDCGPDIQRRTIDIAFVALHGAFGEDGGIQSLLEQLHIVYTGSGPRASRLALDKSASRELFAHQGLTVPPGQVLRNPIVHKIDCDFPVVVKPSSQGSSIGLSIVHDKTEFTRALDTAFTYDSVVLVERYIEGKELTVGIVGDEALPVIEIVPKTGWYDYTAKYTAGMTEYLVPAPLSQELSARVQRDALTAHRTLGCKGLSRVDFRLDHDDTPFILEVNTIPGLTGTSLLPKAAKAHGVAFGDLCVRILTEALRHNAAVPAR